MRHENAVQPFSFYQLRRQQKFAVLSTRNGSLRWNIGDKNEFSFEKRHLNFCNTRILIPPVFRSRDRIVVLGTIKKPDTRGVKLGFSERR